MPRILRGAAALLTGAAVMVASSSVGWADDATPTPEPTPTAAPTGQYVETKQVIGTSRQGRSIVAYYRGYDNATRVIVLLGQMHGDESAGVAVAQYARDRLKVADGSGVWIVPTMNPDGRARGTRNNANGVDLNRNWKTSGWTGGPRKARYWGGRSPASEPETRAFRDFLLKVQPMYVASIHQPLSAVGASSVGKSFQKKLGRCIGLRVRTLSVGTGGGKTSPTMTSYYNKHFSNLGVTGKAAITIELPRKANDAYRAKTATCIYRAAKVAG